MKNYIKNLMAILFLLFSSSTLLAQELKYEDFDKDNDGWIEKEEFKTVFTDYYWDDWNNVDDPYLDDEDFYTFTYNIIDVDNDEMLSLDEWTYGYNYYYGDYLLDDFTAYDIDGDGFVEYTEYTDPFYDTDFFVSWDVDRDTYLSEEELGERVFERWDTNDTGLMSRAEFKNFKRAYEDIK